MGNTAILIGAVALGTALICLFLGYRFGRSNLKSQIEGALDMARVSADAREYSLREQLEEQMIELGKLRAYAEEVLLSQQQLERVQASRLQNPSGRSVVADAPHNVNAHRPPELQNGATSVPQSGEKAMQDFLNSKDARPKPPGESQDEFLEKNRRLPVTKFPVRFPNTFTPQNATPERSKSPAVQPIPANSPAVQPPAVKSPTVQPQPARSQAVQPLPASPPAVQPLPAKSPVVQPHGESTSCQAGLAASPAGPPRTAVNNDDWDEFAKSLEALKSLQK